MKLHRLILISVLFGALSVVGCGDDGGSSTGGTGGDMDPNVICDVGLCLTNEVAKADCVNDVSTCISVGMRVDECIGVALLENCNVAEQ